MNLKKYSFLYYFIFLLSFCPSQAKEIDAEQILVFSKTENILVPNIDPQLKTKQINFFVDSTYLNKYLAIKPTYECHLFVNNTYFSKISPNAPFSLFLNDKSIHPNDLISIYSLQNIEDIHIYIYDTYKSNADAKLLTPKINIFEITQQNKANFNTLYIICVALFFVTIAIAKYMGIEARFFTTKSNNSNFSVHSSSTRTTNKSDFSQLEIIVLSSLIVMFLAILYFCYSHNFFCSPNIKQSVETILFFAKFTIILIATKIVLHLIFGYFLKIQGFTTVIITEIYRLLAILIFFTTIFLFLSVTPFYAILEFNYQFKWVLPFILFLILFIREFYLLLFKFGFNKNYLFAYICICDLYPFVYILKLT